MATKGEFNENTRVQVPVAVYEITPEGIKKRFVSK